MTEPVLRLEGLRKNFGSLVVTDDVTLDILPGEMHAIIGPNGAGKTTLINQISGLVPPDEGKILFGGADVTLLPPQMRAMRGLSRSFQITSILPGFPVLENVALAVQARDGSSCAFLGAPLTRRRSTFQRWRRSNRPALPTGRICRPAHFLTVKSAR